MARGQLDFNYFLTRNRSRADRRLVLVSLFIARAFPFQL